MGKLHRAPPLRRCWSTMNQTIILFYEYLLLTFPATWAGRCHDQCGAHSGSPQLLWILNQLLQWLKTYLVGGQQSVLRFTALQEHNNTNVRCFITDPTTSISIISTGGRSVIQSCQSIVDCMLYLPGAPMRRGGLSVWVRLYVCMYNVCRQKTRLFAVLLLENRHEIALYSSASRFIFFERCLQSRKSLLSSAMAMVSNSCTAPRGIVSITVTGCVGPRRAWESAGENVSKQ